MNKFIKIRRILILILALNWFVAFSKIFYGLITRCASMTADGFHSFGDGASNVLGLIGIWAASKPKDELHPYGHKKFETIATLGIAVILFITSFNIIKEAVFRLFYPVVPDVTATSFILMAITICINIFVMRYEYSKGHHLKSDILVCDSMHTRSDIFASLIVIGTLVSIKFGFYFLDTIISAIIAALIAKSGIDIIKASSNVLCDANVLARARISEIVKNVPGVISVHKIRTRGRQDDIHIDLHVIINAKMYVYEAHELSHRIESSLKKGISGVTDVAVHMEPHK
ncbi:MAG: cation diffusion facilitator family transporter [Candidatus Omnitrophota bacterium]|jgi:cation diffusion facilitator family transporter